jgi:glyoxylate utilization-related uncharacterized protein
MKKGLIGQESESEEDFSFKIKTQNKKKKKNKSKNKKLYKRVIKRIKQTKKLQNNQDQLEKLLKMKRNYEKKLGIESKNVSSSEDDDNEKEIEEHKKKEMITDLIQNEKELEGLEIVQNKETGKYQYSLAKQETGKLIDWLIKK